MLDQAGAWDDELVRRRLRLAPGHRARGGRHGFVAGEIERWPHAPWWEPQDGFSLISTGQILGSLLAHGVEHPWVETATARMWEGIGALADPGAYDLYGVLRFLERVPDRERAEAALERAEPAIRNVATLDPDAPGEVHSPLDFAPRPDSLARRLFDDATIAAHLDQLAAGQQDDGGWTFNFPAWSPAQEADWRGSFTVDALDTLRRNERF